MIYVREGEIQLKIVNLAPRCSWCKLFNEGFDCTSYQYLLKESIKDILILYMSIGVTSSPSTILRKYFWNGFSRSANACITIKLFGDRNWCLCSSFMLKVTRMVQIGTNSLTEWFAAVRRYAILVGQNDIILTFFIPRTSMTSFKAQVFFPGKKRKMMT